MEIHPYIDTNGLINQLNLTSEKVEQCGFQNGGIWFEDTKTIICGTFPPAKEYKNRKGYIHYSSPRNKFWRHIDKIYGTNLYIKTKIANDEAARIENSLDKIFFLKKNQIGLVDIFTKVCRRNEDSSRDNDLIPQETIFQSRVFDNIIQNGVVKQIIFVYRYASNTFEDKIYSLFGVTPKIERNYGANCIPLEVKKVIIKGKELLLSYSPIHGRILDVLKRKALKKAIQFDHR